MAKAVIRGPGDLPEHVRVMRSLRPARICTIFAEGEGAGDWLAAALRTMEAYSRSWGGEANTVLPLAADGSWDPALSAVVAASDPDHWASYAVTRRGQQMAQPDRFNEWIEGEAQRFAEQNEGPIEDARRMLSDANIMSTPINLIPHELVSERILKRSSPFAEDDIFFSHSVQADEPVGNAVADLLSLESLPATIKTIDASRLPQWAQLLAAMSFGAISPSYEKALTDRGVAIEAERPEPSDLAAVLARAWTISVRGLSEPWPLATTRVGCVWTEPVEGGWWTRPLQVVCGSSAADFALALALHRATGRALWMPAEALEDYSTHLHVLASACRAAVGRTDRKLVQIISADPEREPVEAFATELATALDESFSVEVSGFDTLRIGRVRRLYDRDRFDRPAYQPRAANSLSTPIEPLFPSEFRTGRAWDAQWQMDMRVDGYVLPARHELNQLLTSEEFNRESVRVSAEGFSSRSHSQGLVVGSQLEEVAFRPLLSMPNFREVISSLLRPQGVTAQTSSAGAFLLAACERFGGLEAFSSAIVDPITGPLLREYARVDQTKDSSEASTFVKNLDRAFLSFKHAAALTESDNEALADHLDQLVGLGVLSRGYLLTCPTCSFDGWYQVDAPADRFRCIRCSNSCAVDRRAWKTPPSGPHWYYALDEAVFQALKQGTDITARALTTLADQSSSLMWLPETDFMDETGQRIGEVDIVACSDGRLVIGEAKRSGTIAKTAKAATERLGRLEVVADLLGVDKVVFASGGTWSDASRRNFEKFESIRFGVDLLEGLAGPDFTR